MRSKIIYKEILIVSTEEEKSRKIKFEKSKNIIYAKNDRGKSTIIKTIFWSMGLRPSKLFGSNRLSRNIIAVLTIEYNDEVFYFFRNNESRKIFDRNKNLLFETESNSIWQAYLSDFFEYRLELTHIKTLKQYPIGLHGLLTPYYIDQDVGWSQSWDGPFEGVKQYYDFYPQVIKHFTGVLSEKILSLEQEKKKLTTEQKELDLKIKLYSSSSLELIEKKSLSSTDNDYPSMDKGNFQKIITDTVLELKEVQNSQILFKDDLSEIFNQKQIALNLLKNAYLLHKNIVGDIDQLSEHPDNNGTTIQCPICHTEHKEPLIALAGLEVNLESVNQNIFHLKSTLEKLKKEEKTLQEDLNKINSQINRFKEKFKQPLTENYTFEDVIKIYANEKIENNITKHIEKTNLNKNEIDNKLQYLDQEINTFSKTHEIKDNIQKVRDAIKLSYNKLKVDIKTYPLKIYHKSNLSGSSNPRSILALHLAYISQSFKNTSLPTFPIVIDTIQQNGQDDTNMGNMLDVISEFRTPQIILGMEKLPIDIENYDFNIIKLLNPKYSLLENDNYLNDLDEINSFSNNIYSS